MSSNGSNSKIVVDRPSRPRASERETRAKAVLWDRIKLLLFLGLLWLAGLAVVWSTTVRPLNGPFTDALRIAISDYSWSPVSHLYQSFMKDGDRAYLAKILMEGGQSEHEEETGSLRLHDHPFNKDLVISEVSEIPFRELWMRDGMQTFDPLIQLETA